MRRLRFLIAIPAIAGLAIMGATGASAAPAHQVAHARAMTATSSGADPWTFENANGLYIAGLNHGSDLFGDTSSGTVYEEYPQSEAPGFYAYSPANGLCWNTLGAAGDQIGIDSCPANDYHEWFTGATPIDGKYGYLETATSTGALSGLCIWGAGNGKTLFLKACAIANRDLWYKASV
jgi:hypothetical protein